MRYFEDKKHEGNYYRTDGLEIEHWVDDKWRLLTFMSVTQLVSAGPSFGIYEIFNDGVTSESLY